MEDLSKPLHALLDPYHEGDYSDTANDFEETMNRSFCELNTVYNSGVSLTNVAPSHEADSVNEVNNPQKGKLGE